MSPIANTPTRQNAPAQDPSRIRDLAYQIWESEGRPEQQQARHWAMAEKLAAAEAAAPALPAAATRQSASKKAAAAELAAPAAAKKPPSRAASTPKTASKPAKPKA